MSKNHCSPDNLPEQVEHPKHYKFVDHTGQRYGRLTAMYYIGRRLHGTQKKCYWLCQCDCGTHVAVQREHLQSGATQSCGCLHDEAAQRPRTHGCGGTLEYNTWWCMTQRCTNQTHRHFSDYGGRGITVCERWLNSVAAFCEDMGPRPTPTHTLERIDNNGNYEPGNCRWATRAEQLRNTRRTRHVTYGGTTQCVADWADAVGLHRKTLRHRLKAGWPVGLAFTAPPRSLRMITHNGETHSLTEWAAITGIKRSALNTRLSLGWSVDRALTTPSRRKQRC